MGYLFQGSEGGGGVTQRPSGPTVIAMCTENITCLLLPDIDNLFVRLYLDTTFKFKDKRLCNTI